MNTNYGSGKLIEMRDVLVQNAGLTRYPQMGREVRVVLQSACPEKTSPLFEPPTSIIAVLQLTHSG